MKIQYASDLHLELSGNSRWIKHHPLAVAGDILILAGDITYLGEQGGVNNPFWDWCSDNFEKTVVVPGNHEYYGGFHLEDTIDHWELEKTRARDPLTHSVLTPQPENWLTR